MDTTWKIAFKTEMKRKGITIAVLARALGLSVPGTKKIFQKSDISLERFKRICQALELSPSQLIDRDTQDGLKVKTLSRAADNYLTKERRAFYLYWSLVAEKLSLVESMRLLKIEKAESYRYLRKLDEFGLIRWDKDDEIILPDRVPFLFDRKATCAMRFAQGQAHTLVDQSLEAFEKGHSGFSLRYLALSEEQTYALSLKLKEEINKHSRQNPYDGRILTKKSGKQPVRILLCVQPGEIPLGEYWVKAAPNRS